MSSNTDKELLDCLRKIDHKTFAENTKHFLHYPFVGPNVWKPYFEGHNVSNAIFHDHPENLLRSGNYNKVPVIMGSYNFSAARQRPASSRDSYVCLFLANQAILVAR